MKRTHVAAALAAASALALAGCGGDEIVAPDPTPVSEQAAPEGFVIPACNEMNPVAAQATSDIESLGGTFRPSEIGDAEYDEILDATSRSEACHYRFGDGGELYQWVAEAPADVTASLREELRTNYATPIVVRGGNGHILDPTEDNPYKRVHIFIGDTWTILYLDGAPDGAIMSAVDALHAHNDDLPG